MLGVGAPIGFSGSGNAFDHAHASQIHNADFFFAPVRSVDLAKTGHVLHSRDPRDTGNRFDQLVGTYIDNIQNSWTKVSGKQIRVFLIHGQIVESLSLRASKINRGNLLQGLGFDATRKDQDREQTATKQLSI